MNIRPVPDSAAMAPVAVHGYRPEVDGLRALAVVPVIFFHAGYALFPGGYVGVDVFFVISGYLITTIIMREIGEGSFSIAGFYERRARRILPALTLVVVVSCVAALWLMTPDELADFSESVISVALFVSNFQFMTETGYFATASELKPLLHTWSLAVEEQYYLAAPLVLALMSRWRLRWTVLVTGALAAVSLCLAQWASTELQDWNFFFTPSRVWEIMAGALAAFALLDGRLPRRFGARPRQALAAAGILLVIVPVFVFDDRLPFPSLYTLPPTLGAALVILFAGPGTLAARALSLRPVVAIGLISYSAYLWHQPLLAFARLAGQGTGVATAIAVAAAFGLAWLSWRFVELPFRDRRRLSRPQIFKLAGAAGAALVAVGLAGVAGRGLPERYGEPEATFFRSLHELSDYRLGCRMQMLASFDFDWPCLIGDQSEPPRLAVWGDSHAEALASGLGEALRAEGRSALVFDKGGCLPLAGAMETGNRQRDRDCLRQNRAALSAMRAAGIKSVLLAGRWGDPATATKFAADAAAFGSAEPCQKPAQGASFRDGFEATLCLLRVEGFDVAVLRQVPPLKANPVRAMYNRRTGTVTTATITFPFSRGDYGAMPGSEVFRGLDAGLFLDPYDRLCNAQEGRCRAAQGGVPLYRDNDHVSVAGARLVAPMIVRRFGSD